MAADDATPPKKPAARTVTPPPKPVQVGGESFLDRILPHITKIAIVCVGVAVVVSIVFGVRAIKQRGQRKTTEKLAAVMELAHRPVRAPGDPAPKKADESFADDKARAIAVLAAIDADDVKVPPQFKGPLLITAGKYDDAVAAYRDCDTAEAVTGVICREGEGLAIEAKAAANTDVNAQHAGYQAALEVYKTMQTEDDGPRAALAHYHQGRMLELLGKRDEAKAAFEKAKTIDKDANELAEMIEARLAVLGA